MNRSFICRSFYDVARLGALASLLAGCPVDGLPDLTESSGTSVTPNACTPGEQISCSCPGAADGIQVCLSDSSGYDACQCGDPLPIDSSTGGGNGSGSTSIDPSATGTGSTSGMSTDTGETTDGMESTDSTGTTGESESSSSTTGAGVCDMYMGGVGTLCDPWLQDCPAGEKCIAYAAGGGTWDATQCTPIDPNPAQPGDPCVAPNGGAAGEDNCDIGSMCWSVDFETNVGTCVALCNGCPDEPTCDDPTAFCVISNQDVLTLCIPGCDPLAQACPAGEACYPIDDTFVCAPDASGVMGVYGDPCEFINVCDPGLVCDVPMSVPGCASAVGCCTDICDISDPAGDAQCTGVGVGQVCSPWFAMGMAPPGYEDVGVCTVP
ncbi:MAG: hypothetical protein AAGF11_03905 [Myxococcota bacterium]